MYFCPMTKLLACSIMCHFGILGITSLQIAPFERQNITVTMYFKIDLHFMALFYTVIVMCQVSGLNKCPMYNEHVHFEHLFILIIVGIF